MQNAFTRVIKAPGAHIVTESLYMASTSSVWTCYTGEKLE